MTLPNEWFDRNNAYLAAALAQLRHRLNAATPPRPPAVPAEVQLAGAEPPATRRGLFRRWPPGDPKPSPEAILLPALGAGALALEAQRLADAVAEAAACEPPPALVTLGRRFGLTSFELDVLTLCIAVELDPATAAALHGGRPSFGLALSALPDGAWEALAPDRPLRHWRLIEIERSDGRPLTASALRVDERVLNFAKGVDHIDARLAVLLCPALGAREALPDSQAQVAADLANAMDPEHPGVAVLRGADRRSKQEVAAAAAEARGLTLQLMSAGDLPAHPDELDQTARLWHRETLLAPLALFLDAHGLDKGNAEGMARVARFIGRSGGPLLVDTRDGIALGVDPVADCTVRRPSPSEQVAQWQAALSSERDGNGLARALAGRFDLGRRTISEAARAAIAEPPATPLRERLMHAVLTRTRPDMSRLADRIEVKARFEDLVLPTAQATQLQQLVAQVENRSTVLGEWGFAARMNRGLGVSALFAGDSGTGKTMAAEVVANALGLDLYRIDLAAVVSKYIGETEKNLGALFDAADAGGAVLLFDEADALFGKRSEVKDSHDRFANIEIDYLLQRMEAFRGLAILATNLKSALDPAFTRRLRFIVDFPYPDMGERQRIWERAFPAATPVEELDFARLARLDLTGAAIQSVALNAAFLAAERDTRVTMPLLMETGRAEFRKLDRPINEADFRPLRQAGGGA